MESYSVKSPLYQLHEEAESAVRMERLEPEANAWTAYQISQETIEGKR
jgi:hypothetical protein